MDALIVTAAGTGLALAMLLVPVVAVATVTLAAMCLFIGTSAAVLACIVGVPAADWRDCHAGKAPVLRR